MATVPRTTRKDAFSTGLVRPFKVAVTYDGFESGLRAVQVYQRVVARFDQEFAFDADFWRFEVLSIPSVGEQAAITAAESDLIIISSDARNRLPLQFQVWTETWMRKKVDQDSALVCLSEHAKEAIHGSIYTRAYLRGVTARGNMTFISQPIQHNNGPKKSFVRPIQSPDLQFDSVTEFLANRKAHSPIGNSR